MFNINTVAILYIYNIHTHEVMCSNKFSVMLLNKNINKLVNYQIKDIIKIESLTNFRRYLSNYIKYLSILSFLSIKLFFFAHSHHRQTQIIFLY